MAQTPTLYRFQVDLSDIDRNRYESFELRIAMHPSESLPYLVTRVIAYALNLERGLELTQGIGSPDEPALRVSDLTGICLVWIDVGTPSARRLHKASKAAKKVRVYTYRDPSLLDQECAGTEIHKREAIEIFALAPDFLRKLGETVERDNVWQLLHTQGELSITVRGVTVHGELREHRLKP